MKKNQIKRLSECIICSEHVMQTSCAVICGFFRDSYRELPMVLCDDPSQDYIEECPRLPRNAKDFKVKLKYRPRIIQEKASLPMVKQKRGELVKLFG